MSRRTKHTHMDLYALYDDGSICKRNAFGGLVEYPVVSVDNGNYRLPYRKYDPLDLDYTRAHRERFKAAHAAVEPRNPIGDVKLATLYALTALGKHVYAGTAQSKRKKRK